MSLTDSARILYGSPLSHPKVAKFAAIALAVLVIITTHFIVKDVLTPLKPEALQVFFLAMLWGGLLCIIPLSILWFLDRREHELTWLYILAILWGALIATAIAKPINDQIIGAEPVITPEEYEAVKSDRIFRTRRIDDTDRRTSAAIVWAQNELAFRKWRVKRMGQSPDKDELAASWREELWRLRDSVSRMAV